MSQLSHPEKVMRVMVKPSVEIESLKLFKIRIGFRIMTVVNKEKKSTLLEIEHKSHALSPPSFSHP